MKTERDANTRLLASDFKTGRVKLVEHECPHLVKELKELERDLKTGKERSGQENHCIDTVLYGVRAAKHYITENWESPPVPGSTEWETELMRLDRERDLQEARERRESMESGRVLDIYRNIQ